MRQSRQSFWVGLFVLAGLAALCVLIIMFGRAGLWGRRTGGYVIKVQLERATGIRVGTLATVGGIQVGRVRAVDFADPEHLAKGALVEIVLDPGRRLREGSRALASEPGLGMGRPPIIIVPGEADAPFLPSGAVIPGEMSSAIQSLIPPEIVSNFDRAATHIGELAAALKPVADDIHEILQPRDVAAVDRPGGPPGNLASAIARVDASFKHINEVLGDPETKSALREAINNLHGMSADGKLAVATLREAADDARAAFADAKTLIADARQAVDNAETHVERVTRSFTDNLEILSSILVRVHSITTRIDRGEGTIGRLANDDRFYEALVLTFRRLSEAIEEFRLLAKTWQESGMRIRTGI